MPFFLRISFTYYNLKATNTIIQDINLYHKKIAHAKYSSNIPSTVKYGYVFIEKLSFLPQNISVARWYIVKTYGSKEPSEKKWSQSPSFLRDIGILCPCGRDCQGFPQYTLLLPKRLGMWPCGKNAVFSSLALVKCDHVGKSWNTGSKQNWGEILGCFLKGREHVILSPSSHEHDGLSLSGHFGQWGLGHALEDEAQGRRRLDPGRSRATILTQDYSPPNLFTEITYWLI